MKLISVLLSLAVIGTQAVDVAKSKHSFDFKEFAQNAAATKAEHQSERKLHNHIVQGREHVKARSDDAEEILFSTECRDFVLRMIEEYPALYYEDLLDIDLFACNPLSFQLLLGHYTSGVNQTALEGEPALCVDTFSEVLKEVIEHLETLHSDTDFCGTYEQYFTSEECSSVNITDAEVALLDPWTPEEITESCTDGEVVDVIEAFIETIAGPEEEDRCKFAMKQIIVDNQINFQVLAMNDQVCLALIASLEGRDMSLGDDIKVNCLGPDMCF